MERKKVIRIIIALVLFLFAAVTLFMSSAVLFDWFGIRAKQGNFVPFIVKTNLTAGVLYLLVLYGFLKSEKWAFWVMLTVALILLYAFGLFYIHIHTGGLYENKTIAAMAFRILLTLIISGFIYINLNKRT
ncbi:hypothetical protein [Haloflavibacter putidus]|uniref:DoxX-like family protein n=1 Tax=Haloflavibacter putidus TaxID=2576776 RepID=A0A507ZHN0_9FLAO|nr:hypothetical protein [Haloflavibacter putidus]TQD36980.1 hypothetical protein FKR84_10245 [Haloflavibacter putidus]